MSRTPKLPGRIRPWLAAALCCLLLCLHLPLANAQPPIPPARHNGLSLDAGSGQVVTLPSAAANVFVADPKVVEVRPASATSLFVFGVGAGRTTVAAMDTVGNLISQYEITVHPSTFGASEAQAAIARLMPGSRVKAQPQPKGLVLGGQVNTPAEAAQAVAIARGYINDNQLVENQISIQSSIQVTLRVRIAEMSRQVIQNLGINWQALGTIGSIGKLPALALNANAAVLPLCVGLSTTLTVQCQGVGFNGVIDALAQDNLAHILAEPNLTVISGQPASFLVGGEFPIPVAQQQGQISVEFKKYGITLAFLPTVYSDGRINLHVSPEVSELTNQGAVQLAAGNSTIQIPALIVRRAETTVELGSGQSFAIAGLLLNDLKTGTNGLPFLENIPVLGALFKSNAYQHNETELVILVTPFVVKPVDDVAALRLPTDNVTPPTDLERILIGRQVGLPKAGDTVRMRIPGDAGFIVQ